MGDAMRLETSFYALGPLVFGQVAALLGFQQVTTPRSMNT